MRCFMNKIGVILFSMYGSFAALLPSLTWPLQPVIWQGHCIPFTFVIASTTCVLPGDSSFKSVNFKTNWGFSKVQALFVRRPQQLIHIKRLYLTTIYLRGDPKRQGCTLCYHLHHNPQFYLKLLNNCSCHFENNKPPKQRLFDSILKFSWTRLSTTLIYWLKSLVICGYKICITRTVCGKFSICGIWIFI